MSKSGGVRLGKTRIPPLPVAGEIFDHYQPEIGQTATLLWLNLRWAAHAGIAFEIDDWADKLNIASDEVRAAADRLVSYGLIETIADGGLVVHDPLPFEAFEVKRREADQSAAASADARKSAVVDGPRDVEVAVAAQAPAEVNGQVDLPLAGRRNVRSEEQREAGGGSVGPQPVMRSPLSKRRRNAHMLKLVEEKSEREPPLNEDMQAVVQIYHKRIGMMGPTQYEKLRFWVEEQGMEGAVVALAIEETVQSADVPRISYLEGILRNWFNDGIRTLADVHRQKSASKVLGKGESSGAHQGVPNAGAYQSVNPEWVAKWKEMYPDEYDA